MFRLSLIAGLLTMVCSSCGIDLSFEPYEVKHPLNLEKVLGRDVVLVGPDTVALRVQYQPETGQNLLTRADRGDTLLLAWAVRYRHLYYLTSVYDRQHYFVEAMKVQGDKLQGLVRGSRHIQLDSLHHCIDRGDFAELVVMHKRTTDDDEVQLRYHPRKLHRFFKSVVTGLPIYRIVPAAALAATAAPAKSAPAVARPDTAQPATGLIRDVYPNPAHTQVTVQLADSVRGTLRLLRADGSTVLTQPATPRVELMVTTLPAGTYLLHVRDARTSRVAARRLVVQH